jgi:hypothetical protein
MDYDHMLTKDEIIDKRDELYAAGQLNNADGSLTSEGLKLQALYEKNEELEATAKQLHDMLKNLSQPEAVRLFEFLLSDESGVHRTYQQLLFSKIWAAVEVHARGAGSMKYEDDRNKASKAAAAKAWEAHPFYFPFI